jgi:hypothetical protein
MAYIAYYFHWSLPEIMELEHAERRRWAEEISKVNQQLSEALPGRPWE